MSKFLSNKDEIGPSVGSAIEISHHDHPRHSESQITTGEPRNPLEGIPREQLKIDARLFAIGLGLQNEITYFEKGALAAQSPKAYEDIAELTEDDRVILRNEVEHRWRHPKALYFTILMNSISAAIQGWDQTGSNGANLSFPQAFGIADKGEDCLAAGTCARNSWIIGAINSAPYMAICVIACWLSDPVNNWVGRRGAIFLGAIFSILGPVGQALCQTWPQILFCRILLGMGMGLKEVTVPVFSAENSPPNIRGALVMSWQLFSAFGIMLGFLANLAVAGFGDIAWRLQLGSAMIPAVPLLFGIYLTPESPRWLLKKCRFSEAYESLLRLRGSNLLAARDLYIVNAQLELEQELIEADGLGKRNFFTRCIELFTIPRIRRATQASGIIMAAQQFFNLMSFYSSTLFEEAGASNTVALLASWGYGMAMFIFAIPALWTIDRWGRRALLLATFPNMCWALLATGMAFHVPQSSPAHLGVICLFNYLFAAFYGPGQGPVAFVYSAEVFPLSHREVGMAWAVATNNFWAIIVAQTSPPLLQAIRPQGVFTLYSVFGVICLVLIFFFLPETKQRSLEELDDIFSVSTRRHAYYQLKEALPWWFKRYIMRKEDEPEPTLYCFEVDKNTGSGAKSQSFETREELAGG
ncbi:hypothetical protein CORC01_11711 [Colletotrichum orchidophilum]|uniref:Major facilitator superfamily (MFS) profile domain-containing protein n=1 Tax=Colletotrichum orchidophilum TaxID=1209926 RepID=A0A1G4AUZ9_9PEZI|nr:uncharacterized protein CORC01_11711 [Colletotrichum orchidophilum]OHE92988.1 hypothetical protein CORC01_11711 [Colletotrichum orchidophilum]